MCSKQLITSNPVTTYGFRTPTGDFYGRVTFENGQGEDSVMVRLESDAILPGYSLEFNGSDSAVITNGELLRKATQAFTVQAWVSPNSGMQVGSILQKQNMFDLGLRNDNFYFTVNGTTITLDTMSVETMKRSANYIHLSGVYDNGVAKLYVNGRLAKEGNVSSSPAANSNAVGWGKGYQGYLDEVRMWGIALTPNHLVPDDYRYIVGNERG